MTIPQAAGLPNGRPAAARYVRDFIESVKASGFVAASLKRHGLTPDDAIVAASAANRSSAAALSTPGDRIYGRSMALNSSARTGTIQLALAWTLQPMRF